MTKFISVIIPVYNDENGVRLVLDALLKQDYPLSSYEIIPVDNGSTDNTKDILKKYATEYPKNIVLANEDNIQGSYAARNKGIELSKGDILAFTDADCVPDKSWLTNGVYGLLKHKASFGAGYIRMTFKSSYPNTWEYVDAAGKLNQKSYVENSCFGATANLFVMKRVIDKHGAFNEMLQSGGDYEFGYRLTSSGEKLIYIEDAMVYHPARSTFKGKLNKSKRVAHGQYMLSKLDLVNATDVKLRDFIPIRRISTIPGVKLGILKKIIVVIVANLFKYYNLSIRLLAKFS